MRDTEQLLKDTVAVLRKDGWTVTEGELKPDDPHSSDCAFWCDEPCDCMYGKPEYD